MTRTFLLGVGAQKAGTTSVYRYLKEHPECAIGPIKETAALVSYYDADDTTIRKQKKIDALRVASRKLGRRIKNGRATSEDMKALLGLVENFAADFDLDYYLKYFKRQFEDRPDATLTADITPIYCALTEQNLRDIKARLEGADFRVKVLFLMRDPAERCYSSLRMRYRRGQPNKDGVSRLPHENFVANATSEYCQIRTQYENIVPRIEAVFAPEDRLITFYESFFTEASMRSFCEFLGISYVATDHDRRFNASPREQDPSPEDWAAVRAAYDDTYRFCAKKWGADTVARLWKTKTPAPS